MDHVWAGRDTVQASVSLSKPTSLKKPNPPAVRGESHGPPRQGRPPSEPATRSRERGAAACRLPAVRLSRRSALPESELEPRPEIPLCTSASCSSSKSPRAEAVRALRPRAARGAQTAGAQGALGEPSFAQSPSAAGAGCRRPRPPHGLASHALSPRGFSYHTRSSQRSVQAAGRWPVPTAADATKLRAALSSGRQRLAGDSARKEFALTARLPLKQKLITVTHGFSQRSLSFIYIRL